MQLVESREHVSARVLSTTNEEEQTKKENPIKLITDGVNQEVQIGILEKTDATSENVNGQDALDVNGNRGKLARSVHISKASQNMVSDEYVFFSIFLS